MQCVICGCYSWAYMYWGALIMIVLLCLGRGSAAVPRVVWTRTLPLVSSTTAALLLLARQTAKTRYTAIITPRSLSYNDRRLHHKYPHSNNKISVQCSFPIVACISLTEWVRKSAWVAYTSALALKGKERVHFDVKKLMFSYIEYNNCNYYQDSQKYPHFIHYL